MTVRTLSRSSLSDILPSPLVCIDGALALYDTPNLLSRVHRMASEIVVIGFTCGSCGNKVPVLGSANLPERNLAGTITAKCSCGVTRDIPEELIQSLDVWRESTS
jgi:hypothetical protein